MNYRRLFFGPFLALLTAAAFSIPLAAPEAQPERSRVPSAKEWVDASPEKLARTSAAAKGCVASRVREWLRVRCPVKTFAISLLGGSNEGLAFWIGPVEQGQPGEVQFPLRQGDRRVIQFWTYGKDGEGNAIAEPALVLQEHWLEGDASPTVSVL